MGVTSYRYCNGKFRLRFDNISFQKVDKFEWNGRSNIIRRLEVVYVC